LVGKYFRAVGLVVVVFCYILVTFFSQQKDWESSTNQVPAESCCNQHASTAMVFMSHNFPTNAYLAMN